MSCILYSFNSYKHLFTSPVIQTANHDLSEPLSEHKLFILNEQAYKARYPSEKTKELLNTQEEIDYEFKETDLNDPIAIFKLLSRIDYQCCDIRCDTDTFNRYNDLYDTFQVLRLIVTEQIIELANDYRNKWLNTLNYGSDLVYKQMRENK